MTWEVCTEKQNYYVFSIVYMHELFLMNILCHSAAFNLFNNIAGCLQSSGVCVRIVGYFRFS